MHDPWQRDGFGLFGPPPRRRAQPEPQPHEQQQPAEPPAEPVEPVSPTYVADLESEVERLRAELAEQEELVRKYAVKAHEAEIDIERAKQRIARASAKEAEQGRRQLLVGFLEVLDDLDRALRSARDQGDLAVVDGVALVRRRFLAKLAEWNVAPAPALDQPFDPERHEAVSRVPVNDADIDGVVVAVVQEGYTIGGATLRPARVAVGQYVAPF